MLASIRHKALLVLGCVLLAVMLAACGGRPSEADIEARVELSKASLVAPTAVSLPTTPTPSMEVHTHNSEQEPS
jgi:hypothetical protein